MYKKIVFTFSFVIISICGFAQKSINDYKYIIIPKSFEFSKSDDQYQLNSLTKFLFNKYGYEAYFVDDLPEDLKANRCLALKAEVSNEKKSMFKTKLEIKLKDCNDSVIMTSKIGESRLKIYDKAHNEALRDAFETFRNFDYKYNSLEPVGEIVVEEKPIIVEVIAVKEEEEEVIKESKTNVKAEEIKASASNAIKSELYYAQAIKNGFQLVNSEPKVVMILLSTSAKEVYIVKDKNAIVYKKDGKWQYSENNGTSTSARTLNIKF